MKFQKCPITATITCHFCQLSQLEWISHLRLKCYVQNIIVPVHFNTTTHVIKWMQFHFLFYVGDNVPLDRWRNQGRPL